MSDPTPEPDLDSVLGDCLSHADGEGIRLGEVLDQLGRAGFCFAALLLSVPFLQPFSLGPYTMLGGITIAVIGWQMGMGKAVPVLPRRAKTLLLHGKGWVGVLRFCQRMLRFCRRFTRTRCTRWVQGERADRWIGWIICAGGALIVVPAANLPFNNTLPALMVFFVCIGWLERDGLLVPIALAWGLLTLLYFALLGSGLLLLGAKLWEWLGR
jgi:hypothetical protein